MRNIYLLLSASLFLSACGGEPGITDPVIKTCSGSISPSSQVTISAGQTTQVKLSFSNCSSVTVTSDNDVKYQTGVNVASDTTLQLSPSKTSAYTFVGNGKGAQKVSLSLMVNVVGKPTLVISGSLVPDSGIVLNSSAKFPLVKQNISSCSAPVFNGTPTTADPKTVKATASVDGDTLVYTPGSTMPVLVNGKRQVTITVSCIGQDGSLVSASITKSLIVPTLKCSGMSPDSVNVAWTGQLTVTCTGNSVTSVNGVDFKGTMGTLSFTSQVIPGDASFWSGAGSFQDPNHFVFWFGHIGPPANYALDVYQWFKNSERNEVPLWFILRLRP